MANAKEIQDRMKSINDTLKITNAMYMISSSKLKKSKKMLSDTEPYFFTLQSEMSRILRHLPDIEDIYFKTNEEKKPEENKKPTGNKEQEKKQDTTKTTQKKTNTDKKKKNPPKMLINMHFGGVFHLDNLLVDFWEIICYSMKYIDNKKQIRSAKIINKKEEATFAKNSLCIHKINSRDMARFYETFPKSFQCRIL